MSMYPLDQAAASTAALAAATIRTRDRLTLGDHVVMTERLETLARALPLRLAMTAAQGTEAEGCLTGRPWGARDLDLFFEAGRRMDDAQAAVDDAHRRLLHARAVLTSEEPDSPQLTVTPSQARLTVLAAVLDAVTTDTAKVRSASSVAALTWRILGSVVVVLTDTRRELMHDLPGKLAHPRVRAALTGAADEVEAAMLAYGRTRALLPAVTAPAPLAVPLPDGGVLVHATGTPA